MSKTFCAFGTAAAVAVALACTGVASAIGPVVGWGSNADGKATPPASVDGTGGSAHTIAAGSSHNCAIEAGTAGVVWGAVVCWGSDGDGQATPPASVDGTGGSAEAIAAGRSHSCAIQAGTGAVVCWGDDGHGQATPPASVNGASGTAVAIAAGSFHSCAIRAGTWAVVCWGDNVYGQAAPPASVDGASGTAVAIAVGTHHSCAIRVGIGAVVCWGSNAQGQAAPPDSVNGVSGTASAIAAGAYHTCAIQAGSGAVVCWGDNVYGQSAPPDMVNGTTGTASAIAAGSGHSCAIEMGSGAVVCWGGNEFGQATPSASVDGTDGVATAIAAGDHHSLAIRGVRLERGDLVVTDYFGGRVVRIDRHGAVQNFSPPPGVANLLVHPSGIAVAPAGDVYVADAGTDRLVRIDRDTGAQTTVLQFNVDPPATPVNVGDEPFGIDLFEDDSGLRHVYVSALNELRVASQQAYHEGFFLGSLVDATLPSAHFGVAVRSDGPVLDSVWIAAGGSGLWAWDSSDDTAFEVLSAAANERYLDIDFADGMLSVPVFSKAEVGDQSVCTPGTGGVFSAFGGVFALSQGGLFRCPFGLVWVPERDEIYVADAANLNVGGEGQVVKLQLSGNTWEQSLFVDAATLGVSAPAGIAYVPEPGGTVLGAIALLALAVAERRLFVWVGTRDGGQRSCTHVS